MEARFAFRAEPEWLLAHPLTIELGHGSEGTHYAAISSRDELTIRRSLAFYLRDIIALVGN